ncbi:hypothetical protein D3C72_138120 [compost metagenome]
MQAWRNRVVSRADVVAGTPSGYKAANAILRVMMRLARLAGRGASTLPLGEAVRGDVGEKSPSRSLGREAWRG